MRNLSILSHRVILPAKASEPSTRNHITKIEAATTDLEDGTIYAVSTTRLTPSAQDVKLVFSRKQKDAQEFSSFSSLLVPGALASLPGSSTDVVRSTGRDHLDIVSFQYLSDGGVEARNEPALCTVTSGGDLVLLPLPLEARSLNTPGFPIPEPLIVGSIEQGILAAAWSPDDELLVIVTAETPENISASGRREGEKVLLMTRDFEVLSEKALRTEEFGEDRAVDVGWGSKATQFHGSEGKAAAAAAEAAAAASKESKSDPRGPKVPDDDGKPRVSWRGDGAFFSISALEPFRSNSSEVDADAINWHRIIRVYARLGALSATSDAAVRGISQALAFRPVGNVIASTQRFGASEDQGQNWAQGRKGRHDVVFFERNGLRHGEFSLREESSSQPEGSKLGWSPSQLQDDAWSRTHYVRELAWNADGSALAVWLSRTSRDQGPDVDVIQIYTTGNYHWYLKQEFTSRVSHSRVQRVSWHAEDPLQMFLVFSNRVEHKQFFWETIASGGRPPHDVACVAVADGSASFLTPFRMQNVPPPMCSLSLLHPPAQQGNVSQIDALSVPVHCAWTQLASPRLDEITGIMALLFQDGTVQLWQFDWGVLSGKLTVGGRPITHPRLVATLRTAQNTSPAFAAYQVAIAGWAAPSLPRDDLQAQISIAVLSSDMERSFVRVLDLVRTNIEDSEFKSTSTLTVESHVTGGLKRLVADPFVPQRSAPPSFYLETENGDVQALKAPYTTLEPLVRLERFCPDLRILARPGSRSSGVIALATNGRLYTNEHVVAKDATSFTLAGSFLVWTNTSHEVRFAPLSLLPFDLISSSTSTIASESVDLGRRVERGSRIVTAVTSLMALVLQMPRGNLETINPRPLVLEVVRRDLDNKRYGAAFRICRTHRMDVNILYDHDPDAFMANIDSFVQQVSDVDHINLFLSGLRNEDVTKSLYKPLVRSSSSEGLASGASIEGKVNRICDAMREELERVDPRKYINSILTTHVRKVPADYESGLSLLLKLKDQDQALAEEAVKYIIFLADADKLFDVALGMYDFTLTLMVAQHAQRKDPREYLPFLRELRGLSPPQYQRFRIDDHLKRHSKALSWLSKCPSAEHHKEALAYIDKHRLYHEAIGYYEADLGRLRDVYDLFGEYLLTRRKFDDAGLAFILANKPRKAMDAYRQSSNWQEVFRIAFSEKLAAPEIVRMAKEIVDDLESSKRYSEAARIALDYSRDVEQGVSLLCRANEFAEARRVLSTHQRQDLIEVAFHPLLSESASALLDDIAEMSDQLSKQIERVGELRNKKAEHPEEFYGEEDPALENLDVMSDTSTQMTTFTRYTRAASVATQSSMATFSTKSGNRKKEAKLKKKQERKKAAGKKGSVFEEDYLYTSIAKLLNERLGQIQTETAKVLPHLVSSSSASLRSKARQLFGALEAFEKQANEGIEKLWSFSQDDDDRRFKDLVQFQADILNGEVGKNPSLGAMTLRSIANRPVPRPKLSVSDNKWRVVLLDSKAAVSEI